MPVRPRKIIITKPGGYDVFSFEDAAPGPPAPGEVQVEVRACGINFADIAVRLGLYQAAKGAYPLCPGLEFSGVVQATGGDVAGFRQGDRIFGASRFGAYSTRINCRAEQIWHLPHTWDFVRGASFPVAYLTAGYALFQVGHLNRSDRVLVHSAAGGVGTALLHLLRINGNCCVGVVGRSEKSTHAGEAGATFVIDKSTEDLWERAEEISPKGYDIILDANGASTLRGSYNHLSPGGRLLIYGFASMFSSTGRKNPLKLIWGYFRTPRFNPFDLTGTNRTISGFNLIYLFDQTELFRRIMARLMKWNSEGQIPPLPITTFPFEEVARAHRALESAGTVGKLVLTV